MISVVFYDGQSPLLCFNSFALNNTLVKRWGLELLADDQNRFLWSLDTPIDSISQCPLYLAVVMDSVEISCRSFTILFLVHSQLTEMEETQDGAWVSKFPHRVELAEE